MELLLGAAVLVLAVALATVVRRARAHERTLLGIARRLGARSAGPGAIRASAERLEGRTLEAEQRLARLSADVDFFGEMLPVGYIRLDADGHVDLANPAAHAMLEVAPGRLLGRTVMEAFVDLRIEAIVDAAQAGGAANGELVRGPRGVQRLSLRARRSPMRGTWILMEDVTELRRLQQIRAEFIDNLSHELRTPLSNVSLLAETLAREAVPAALPEKLRDRIAKIEVETGHLVQMVNELLDLSRIESGTSLVLRDDVDLAVLAAAATDRLRLFAERQGVTLRVAAEDSLPAVRGDEDRLGQVLVNLVHNAVKFSREGGSVVVDVRRANDDVVVAVADNGIGIPRGDRPRIFERFYKVDRARVRGGGTGLGLAIARHVVEGHGGRIWVESEEGVGSTFRFAIPTGPRPPEPTAPPTPSWSSTASS